MIGGGDPFYQKSWVKLTALELILITNRKSHIGFLLVLTSMTLNGVIALIMRFFHRIR